MRSGTDANFTFSRAWFAVVFRWLLSVVVRCNGKAWEVGQVEVHIRWMIRRDMPEVLKIEAASFGNPWTEHDFVRALRTREIIGMVAEYRDEVIGYVVYKLGRRKLTILNIAVDPLFRKCGIGSQITQKIKDKQTTCAMRKSIELAVRESNLDAQLFFKSQGFLATDVLRDFYSDTNESAYLMHYEIRQGVPA